MKRSNIIKVAAVSIGLLTAAVPIAQAAGPDDSITARRAVMRVIGLNFGPMGAMVRDKIPFDSAIFAANAARIAAVSTMPIENYFGPGTDEGEMLETGALPEIWTDMATFKQRLNDMRDATANLATAASGSDEDAMKTALGAAGKSCKSCHDDFRKK